MSCALQSTSFARRTMTKMDRTKLPYHYCHKYNWLFSARTVWNGLSAIQNYSMCSIAFKHFQCLSIFIYNILNYRKIRPRNLSEFLTCQKKFLEKRPLLVVVHVCTSLSKKAQ